MKKFYRVFLAAVSFLLIFVMACACAQPIVPPEGNQGNQSQNPGGNQGENPGGNQNENPGGNQGENPGGNQGENPGGNQGETPPEDDEERAKAYSFRPELFEDMPRISIDTKDGKNDFATVPNREAKLADQIKYTDAVISVDNCAEEYRMEDVAAQVKARGNYTLEYEKKPLRIKFSKKQTMLGLHDGKKYKNWVLLADWKDLSATNNQTAFYLGKTILGSDGYYSSDYCYVELTLNGTYWGVYLLVEQQEAKDGRSSVPEVPELENEQGEEVGYTGTDVGYLMEYDGYYTDEINMPNGAGDPTFELDYNGRAPLKRLNGSTFETWGAQSGYTVKSDIYDQKQLDFLRSYVSNVYKIAYEAIYRGNLYRFNEDYTGLVSATGTVQEVVSAVIDVPSLVDTYLLNEIACDPDIAWSSFYLSADMSETGSKKLTFEAPWDFDSAFGIKNGFVNGGAGAFAANSDNPWLILLINQDWFQSLVREKWAELHRYGVFKTALSLVGEVKEVYSDEFARSLERWRNRVLYGNDELIWELNSYTTQGQASDYLYNWLYKRLNYLSTLWGNGSDILTGTTESVPEEPEAGAKAYRFEAETCRTTGNLSVGENGKASGGKYLGYVDNGGTITLTVTAEADTNAYLYVGLSKRASEATFAEWFTLTVNGTAPTVPMRLIGGCAAGEEEWYTFISVKIAPIPLKAGSNTIVLTVVASTATNVDFFDLYSTVPLK